MSSDPCQRIVDERDVILDAMQAKINLMRHQVTPDDQTQDELSAKMQELDAKNLELEQCRARNQIPTEPSPNAIYVQRKKTYQGAGDGTPGNPLRRITDAVSLARKIWQRSRQSINIWVENGSYPGAFDGSATDTEDLPIILDVPNLSLRGKSQFDLDQNDFPTGYVFPDTQDTFYSTRINPNKAPTRNQAVIMIAPTDSVMTGEGVTVSGFNLESPAGTPQDLGVGILAYRVTGFRITNNIVKNFRIGVQARRASGVIDWNYLSENKSGGAGANGGSVIEPAVVTLKRNRSYKNGATGVILSATDTKLKPEVGRNTWLNADAFKPPDYYDLDHGLSKVPNALTAWLINNDLSGNSITNPMNHLTIGFGLRCLMYSESLYDINAQRSFTADLMVFGEGNNFNSNASRCVLVDAGFPDNTTGHHYYAHFTGHFADSKTDPTRTGHYCLNASDGVLDFLGKPRGSYEFLRSSRYEIQYTNGDLDNSSFLNPQSDKGVTLENHLLVNGIER
jgi:hypothetical protein